MLCVAGLFSVLLAVSAGSINTGMLEPYKQEYNSSVVSCIVEMCDQYYHSETEIIGSLLMVHIQNVTPLHNELIQMLMERNIYTIDLINQYTRSDDNCYFDYAEKAKNYLVAFKEITEVEAALRLWHKLPTWNPLAQFVAVFIKNYDDDEQLYTQVKLAMEAFFEFRALNVKVISHQRNSNVIQMHSWYPYEGTNCASEVRDIHLIEECHYSDDRIGPQPLRNVTLVPPTLIPIDLHGCPLRVAASVYEPFSFYDPARKNFTRGIEVLLIQTIAQALKMTPVFIHINETRENRIISNETGIYSMLLRR